MAGLFNWPELFPGPPLEPDDLKLAWHRTRQEWPNAAPHRGKRS